MRCWGKCHWELNQSSILHGHSSHVVKCISSCRASETLASFSRKVIYSKGIDWLIEMIGKLGKKGWKRVGIEADLGVHLGGTSCHCRAPLLEWMKFKHYFFLLSRLKVLGAFIWISNLRSVLRLWGKKGSTRIVPSEGKTRAPKEIQCTVSFEKGAGNKTINAHHRQGKAWG